MAALSRRTILIAIGSFSLRSVDSKRAGVTLRR